MVQITLIFTNVLSNLVFACKANSKYEKCNLCTKMLMSVTTLFIEKRGRQKTYAIVYSK